MENYHKAIIGMVTTKAELNEELRDLLYTSMMRNSLYLASSMSQESWKLLKELKSFQKAKVPLTLGFMSEMGEVVGITGEPGEAMNNSECAVVSIVDIEPTTEQFNFLAAMPGSANGDLGIYLSYWFDNVKEVKL